MAFPEQQRRPSIWDAVPFLNDPERRARLAIALEGMTLNPNQGLIAANRDLLTEERDARRLNQTVEWLRQQPGGEQFAAALATGAIDPNTAFGGWFESQRPAQAPDPTAAMQNYEYMISQGVEPDVAAERAFGGGGVNVTVGGEGEPQIGTIPQGYEVFLDESGNRQMRPIPGGPEDPSRREERQQDRQTVTGDVVTNATDQAWRILEQSPNTTTGLGGALLGALSPTQAAELRRQVDTLTSNATIANLTAMREASPTGGALGSVTERENAMLAAAAGAIDPNASREDFARALENYERTLLQIVHGADAGLRIFQQNQARRVGEQTPAEAAAQEERPRLRYNPETGGFD